MTNKIAVIGDKDSVLVFRALGVDVFDASSYFETSNLLKNIANDYSIILITDDIAQEIQGTIE